MVSSHFGEFAALLTAFFWTFTALAFTGAGKRIGSLSVNFWRIIIGICFLCCFTFFRFHSFFPHDIELRGWLWLALSGFIGVFLGDLFLFKAFTITGPRIALLLMSLAPPLAAVFSWLFLHEKMDILDFIGMGITLAGISIVILARPQNEKGERSKFKLRHNVNGILFAFLGAMGQATGLVISKIGLQSTSNPFFATQIRLFAGILGFIILITFLKRWGSIFSSAKNNKAMGLVSLGAFFGPFLGISFSLLAIQYANPGIVQTITSITPVLIIPFSIWFFKEKITIREILGAVLAVVGITLFFL
jgi:drug/metabolite transporter (DMT)-like permease